MPMLWLDEEIPAASPKIPGTVGLDWIELSTAVLYTECILYAVILDFILVLYATSGHLRLTLVFLNQDGTAVIMKRERRVDITNTQQ